MKTNGNDIMPTFSCKQLLSSIIRRWIGLDNATFELNGHQIFSIDCKKAIQVLCEQNKCLNNNNETVNMDGFIDKNSYIYNCLGCKESWPISHDNMSSIVSHFSSKWSNNFLDQTYSPKKHIGKLFEQRQVIMKWSHYAKDSNARPSQNITLLTVIRCRKCKLYFPGSFEQLCEKSAPMNLLLQHANDCHKKIVNEWKHHRSLSIKSLR